MKKSKQTQDIDKYWMCVDCARKRKWTKPDEHPEEVKAQCLWCKELKIKLLIPMTAYFKKGMMPFLE